MTTEDLQSQLTVIVPAFNEEQGITATLDSLTRAFPKAEIIVVDDGSTDGTLAGAAAFPAVTIERHAFNRGYGAALKTGMRQAERKYIAWFDADNEHRVEDLMAMLERLGVSSVVAVIGQRKNPSTPGVHTFGKWLIRLLAWSMNLRTGPDINCGLRIFRREAILPYLKLLPNGFSVSLTSLMIMVERGYPIEFVPISLNPRAGDSKVVLADGFQAMTLVLRTIVLFAPLRIFLRVGLFLIVCGLAYGLILAFTKGLGFPTAAVLTVLAGLLLCLQGLVADQISQMRLNYLEDDEQATTAAVEKRDRADRPDAPTQN